MHDAPLHDLLDGETDPDQARRALTAVLRRQRHRRSTRLRLAGVSTVVALGGTAAGLGLSSLSTGTAAEPGPNGGAFSAAGGTTAGARSRLTVVRFGAARGAAASGTATNSGAGVNGGDYAASGAHAGTSQVAAAQSLCERYGCRPGDSVSSARGLAGRTLAGLRVDAILVGLGSARNATLFSPSLPAPLLLPEAAGCTRPVDLAVALSPTRPTTVAIPRYVFLPAVTDSARPLRSASEAAVSYHGSRYLLAAAQLSPAVARVEATFGRMAQPVTEVPEAGVAVFLVRVTSSERANAGVRIVARSQSGAVIASQQLPSPFSAALPSHCTP